MIPNFFKRTSMSSSGSLRTYRPDSLMSGPSDFSDPFFKEVAEGDIPKLEKRAKEKGFNINRATNEKQTALHIAADSNQFDSVLWLLRNGADVHETDKLGWTPLHAAASQGCLNICSLLLIYNADPNAVNVQNVTPGFYLIRHPYSEEWLEVMDLMLERGAELGAVDKYGETLLLHAAKKGNPETVRFLLDHGSDPNSVCQSGHTALHRAVENGNAEMVLLLLKYGADPNREAQQDGKPLDLAKKNSCTPVVDLFTRYQKNKEEVLNGHTYSAFFQKDVFVRKFDSRFEEKEENPSASPTSPEPVHKQAQNSVKDIEFQVQAMAEIIRNKKALISTKSSPRDIFNRSLEQFSQMNLASIRRNSMVKPCIQESEGMRFETGIVDITIEPDLTLLFPPNEYRNWFYYQEHHNYLGRVNKKGTSDVWVPIAISVLQQANNYKVIVRTRLGENFLSVPYNNREKEKRKWKNGLFPDIEKAVKDSLLAARPADKSVVLFLEYVETTPQLRASLYEFEVYDPLRAHVFSIGVLYSKQGQTNENDQFGNEHGSPAFNEFLNFLGDKIPLQGWTGPRADLDVKTNSTGDYGLFRRWKGYEIMFHVSTLLPYTEGVEQQMHRKRRIGNDVAVIVFQEGGAYLPPIRSQFLHGYYVVSPHQIKTVSNETLYNFNIGMQGSVPEFGPGLPNPPLFKKDFAFRSFLLTKVLNGYFASLRSPGLREKIWAKPKESFLVDLCTKYTKKAAQGLKKPSSFA